jgi:hypothetical protein
LCAPENWLGAVQGVKGWDGDPKAVWSLIVVLSVQWTAIMLPVLLLLPLERALRQRFEPRRWWWWRIRCLLTSGCEGWSAAVACPWLWGVASY